MASIIRNIFITFSASPKLYLHYLVRDKNLYFGDKHVLYSTLDDLNKVV